MRQVGAAELVWNVKLALRRIGKQRLRGLISPDHAAHRFALQIVEDIVRQLDRYEVLSDARCRIMVIYFRPPPIAIGNSRRSSFTRA